MAKIYQDFTRYKYGKIHPSFFKILIFAFRNKGFFVVLLFRLGYWCRHHHLSILAGLLERIIYHLYFCEISTLADIDGGLRIIHPLSIIISKNTIIGQNCTICQHVTLGYNFKANADGRKTPIIGDNVHIAPGAKYTSP